MNPNLKLIQQIPAVSVRTPVDINGAGLVPVYIAAKYNSRFAFVVAVGALASATTITLTVKQATDAAGAGAKALTLGAGNVFAGLTGEMLAAADAKVTAGNVVLTTAADANSLVVIDVATENLDVNGGFCYVGLYAADPAKSALVGVVALPFGTQRYASNNDALPDVTE